MMELRFIIFHIFISTWLITLLIKILQLAILLRQELLERISFAYMANDKARTETVSFKSA